MAGLLTPQNNANGALQPNDVQAPQDPILAQVEQEIEEQVPPDLRQGYDAIILSGMDVMFNPKTADLMNQQLSQSDDIVNNVAEGIAKLMVILYNESKGAFSIPAAGLASISLMTQALDYWEKTGGGQVTEDMVAQATKATMMQVLEKFGITGDQLQQVMAAGQQAQAGGAGAEPAQGGAQPQTMGV